MDVATEGPVKRRKQEGDESQQPPGGAEQEGSGLISLLPDDVLREIVARLPSKDAARTQVFSSRWRHIWLSSSPLNLDLSGVSSLSIDIDHISRTLSTHPGPGRRFAVPDLGFSYFPNRRDTLDRWFRSPALRNLQELDFNWYDQVPAPSAFHLFSTLRVAVFSRCRISDDAAAAFCFPRLEQLTLDSVTVSGGTLHGMLAGCRVLHCLLLYNVFACRRVSISSPTIRGIGVRVTVGLQDLIVEDAPCLERLLMLEFFRGKLSVSVISAPKLETLGRLYSDTTVFQMSCFDGLSAARSVKVLALRMDNLSLEKVIYYMRCFPCLEKLYIETFGYGSNNAWSHKKLDPIECLDLHLKKIVLSGYNGNQSHIDFAMFFVSNGRVLDLMRLESQPEQDDDKWIEEYKMSLKLDNRVSRDAEFCFTCDASWNYFRSIRRAHHLLIDDPFCT